MSSPSTSWFHETWTRPSGGREVLQLALPLVMSSLSWTLLTFIDRIFLTWWSTQALAASFPAALLWWTSICFPLGTCMYVSTFVSQYHGARQTKWIGPIVWQGVWLGVLASLLVTLLLPFADNIFQAARHGPAVIEQEVAYYRMLCLGTAAILVSYSLSSFFSGQGLTWIVMLVDGGAAGLNVLLDYLWIFGKWGFPAMGIEGAALATAVAFWIKAAVYVCLILRRRHRNECRTDLWKLNRRLLARLLYFGAPSGVHMVLEVGGFTVFVFLVGRLGELELAATNMAFNVSSVAFMPVFGLATATQILVGQNQGRGRPDLAARATWTTLLIAISYMGFISSLYVLTPDLFLFGFFAQSDPAHAVRIHGLAVILLRYVAAYNIFDALNLVFSNAIKGAGDTHFVSIVSLVMACLLAVGTWVGVTYQSWRVDGCWTFVTLWLGLLGCIYITRFLQGRWRLMQVIDSASEN